MTRGGRKDDQDGPERRCIVTGESGPKGGLVRFAIGPDGQVVPDVLGRLPGRGIYVSARREAVAKAAAKGLFSRAAKRSVTAPADLADTVEALLAGRITDLVSLARKAGEAVTGYEKVREWLVKGRAYVLLQASDGSERGKSKLRPPGAGEGEAKRFVGCLTARELGLSFGRDHAIHAALGAGGLGSRVVEEAARLAGFREPAGGKAADEDKQDA